MTKPKFFSTKTKDHPKKSFFVFFQPEWTFIDFIWSHVNNKQIEEQIEEQIEKLEEQIDVSESKIGIVN